MCASTILILLMLGATTCSSLPRHSTSNDLPQPVLPSALEKVAAVESDNVAAAENRATIVALPESFPTPYTTSSYGAITEAVKTLYNGFKLIQKIYGPPPEYGDNSIMNKIMAYLESFRIIKQIRDRCSDDKEKDDVSCTNLEVHGYYDLFGETWYNLYDFIMKWYNRISKNITERQEIKDSSTVVTNPDTYFSRIVKLLDMFGLDGKPTVEYIAAKNDEEEPCINCTDGKKPQELKEDALTAAIGHVLKIQKHNYWTKSVNAVIKLAGAGAIAALCAQNCGIENFLGIGTTLPPLDADDQAANDAAAAADAAGDTDGDGDVDDDDGRRRDTIVTDSYQHYDHYGDYVGYDHQQPQSQPDQKNYFIGGHDPGYPPGTFPGWYPPAENNNNSNKNYNHNNHLLEPSEHPDFSSRLGHARDTYPVATNRTSITEDHVSSAVAGSVQPALPQPVFRGGRMLDPK